MFFSVSDTGEHEREKILVLLTGVTYDLLVTSPDALPLSYRRLMGARGTKIGSLSMRKKPTFQS